MEKYIDSPFAPENDVPVDVTDADASSFLIKKAADDRISSFVRQVILPQRDPNKIYLHINAMGAGEYYGSNRNGDYFPEDNLLRYFKTFESGHVFRHHINKDPTIALGRVLAAFYNERMHRVELIAEVDKSLGSDIAERVTTGNFPWTSMACRTPYDTCSICGHQAHSRQEYCDHLTKRMNEILPDGRKVYAINNGPLRFFDISIVIRPADPTSGVLEKVAGANHQKTAESNDPSLMELATRIFPTIVQGSDTPCPLANVANPPDYMIPDLSSLSASALANTFAETGIYPSLDYIARILCPQLPPDLASFAASLLPFVAKPEVAVLRIRMEPAPPDAKIYLAKEAAYSSFLPEFIEKRAYFDGPTHSTIGYVQVNPAAPMVDIAYAPDKLRIPNTLPRTAPENFTFFKWLMALLASSALLKSYSHALAEKKAEFEKTANLSGNIAQTAKNGISHIATPLGVASAVGLAYHADKTKHTMPEVWQQMPKIIQKHPYISSLLGGGTIAGVLKTLVKSN